MKDKEKTTAEDLEQEIERYWKEEMPVVTESDLNDIAHHFAKWGAEHLIAANKMIEPSEDLEKAARKSAILQYEMSTDIDKSMKVMEARIFHEIGFIAGAQWQNKQFEKNRLAACDKQTKEEYERETDFATSIIEKEHRQPTFSDAINYGMRLQKEQMLKDAVETTMIEGSLDNPTFVRRKIIIVKED